MEDDFVGAIKIKDGLFIGDEYAAQDFEFVVTNKVTHIINCAGKQIPNYWETVGVIYLTFDWLDSENQIVFDTKGEVVNEIYNFIEDAAKLGEGVLVHSIKGQSRSCCVLTAYFMKRYRWSLYKTLEFLTSRRSDLEIRTSFYHQLLNLESRLFQQADGNVTVNWFEMGPDNDKEEILLRNTFLNARSAPFDEALVNPQAGVDTRPRTINWGDERPSGKGGLSVYLSKESAAAKFSKPPMTSCTSILKGSNKVFKLKVKEEEPIASSSTKGNGSGLRANKSVRNFSEGRNSDAMVDDANTKAIEKSGSAGDKEGKGGKGPNMMRSSSAIYLDKEDNNTRTTSAGKTPSNDKSNNAKVSNVNGNIIHLTVNNYIAPVNNQTNAVQTNNFVVDNEPKPKSGAPKTPEPRPASASQKALEAKKEEENNKQAEPVTISATNGTTSTKGSVSTNYLKSAIEKKLSKEYKSQLSSTAIRGDIQPVTVKTPSGTESKGAKAFKEYAKPSDLKVNYQVLLKNRETPPPRKREEAKRGMDSPNKKAASKSSISTKGGDSSMPYSSYLNSMFSTSFSQLNTVTPSAYATTGEKKTPISAKAAMSYNLTLSQKAQTLTRPQRSNAGQIGDKNYGSSMLGSNLSKSKLEPSSATLVGAKFNNYTSTTQSKGNPVRVTYEKIERPHSATPDRSATPQAGQRRPGTSSGVGATAKGDQRFSVPSKNTTKHGKKDSGTTQDLVAKHRQRSSSPSPMSYNPALSNSSLSLKSKAKY